MALCSSKPASFTINEPVRLTPISESNASVLATRQLTPDEAVAAEALLKAQLDACMLMTSQSPPLASSTSLPSPPASATVKPLPAPQSISAVHLNDFIAAALSAANMVTPVGSSASAPAQFVLAPVNARITPPPSTDACHNHPMAPVAGSLPSPTTLFINTKMEYQMTAPLPSGAPPSPPYEVNPNARKRRNSVPDGRVFACTYEGCNKNFMQLAHLKIHQRKHTGERPYVCAYPGCTKSFTQLGNLKTHERKHTGEKPFKCSFPGCEKAFSQMGNMKTHELLHLGIKPYTCGIDGCDRAFSQLGNLKSHQQKVHHNPSQRRASLKRSISPTSEEDDGNNLIKRRRRSSSAHSSASAASEVSDAVVPSDAGTSEPSPAPRRRSGQTKEERLLAKMKAVLERRFSEESDGLQLPTSDIPEEDAATSS